MALTNSNTYIEPTAGTSLNGARAQQNNSFRSLLTNFKSKGPPVSVNLTASGGALGEVDGMLFRSEATNALYISDSVHVKSSPVGGNFTRVGIGNRVENGIVALGANAKSYEIGELVATVSEDGTLASNARLYLCVSNSMTAGSTVGFLDVGAPQGYSIGTNDNVTFSGQSVSAIRFLATNQIGIGTNSPTSKLDIRDSAALSAQIVSTGGGASISIQSASTDTSRVYLGDSADFNVGYISYNHPSDSLSIVVNTAERLRITSAGSVGIGTASPTEKLEVNGNIKAIDFNSTSDIRLKSDIVRIDNALNKVEQLSGYTFTYNETGQRSTGVIAQEVQKVLPEAVAGNDVLSVSYGNMVGLLIESIKELKAELEIIKQKVN
jgi:hypothetical protein